MVVNEKNRVKSSAKICIRICWNTETHEDRSGRRREAGATIRLRNNEEQRQQSKTISGTQAVRRSVAAMITTMTTMMMGVVTLTVIIIRYARSPLFPHHFFLVHLYLLDIIIINNLALPRV